MRTIILILCVFLVSCKTNKIQQISLPYPGYEYLIYHNYSENDSINFNKESFNNLDKIDFNDFHSMINKNITVSDSNTMLLKRNNIFHGNDESLIKVYFLNEINNPKTKQYLGYFKRKIFSEQAEIETFIIFNIVNDKVKSSFIIYYYFYDGFGSETRKVTFTGDNNYELMVSGWADAGGKFEHLNCFKITEEGFIDTSVECKKGK